MIFKHSIATLTRHVIPISISSEGGLLRPTIYIIIIIIIITLREECKPMVFENRILRRICGHKRDENSEWRRLHNEELRSLYRSLNIG